MDSIFTKMNETTRLLSIIIDFFKFFDYSEQFRYSSILLGPVVSLVK
jgi:hypothetical protein